MATYTENYNLRITEAEDPFNIEDYNGNFEALDGILAENEAAVQEVNEKLGTPEEGETVFSLLKSGGGSIIKSIQTVSATHSTSELSETVLEISPVNPAKCIILFDRMKDSTGGSLTVNYVLTETSLTVTTNKSSTGSITVQFQIVEFY